MMRDVVWGWLGSLVILIALLTWIGELDPLFAPIPSTVHAAQQADVPPL